MADAYASETITVSTSAIGPTAANFDVSGQDVDAIYGTVETADIRLRYDGTNPTATVGHLVLAGGSFTIEGASNVRSLKMIRASTAAVDASVFATYEG